MNPDKCRIACGGSAENQSEGRFAFVGSFETENSKGAEPGGKARLGDLCRYHGPDYITVAELDFRRQPRRLPFPSAHPLPWKPRGTWILRHCTQSVAPIRPAGQGPS